MKTKTILASICLIVLSISFTNCSDDEGDTTKPVITLNAPAEGAVLKIGSAIHFDMDLEDNEMLGSYKVNIHTADDVHASTKAVASGVTDIFNGTWDVSGNRNIHIHHHEIVIKDDVKEGDYHFMVYCTDAAGNQTYMVRNIKLSHDGQSGEH